MRMAIDARMMGPEVTRGIGRYIQELVRALLDREDAHGLVLLVRDPETSPFLGHPRVEHLRADVPWYTMREQIQMPGFFRRARADLVYIPHWNVPLMMGQPFVMMIHDLILLHQPTSAKASTRHPIVSVIKRAGFRTVLSYAARRAATIFVPTQWVADDVRRFLRVPSERVIVTGEGIASFPEQDSSLVPTQPYLLYTGSAYPHKRLDLLFTAWRRLADRFPAHELVVAGEIDVFMRAFVEQARVERWPRVRFLGRVSDAQLVALYARASALVFPSSQEGFGLPPVEALSFGCPVISSDATSLPEVLPKAGVRFFRDGDVDDMMRAIDAVLSHADLFRNAAAESRAWVLERHRWEQVAEIFSCQLSRLEPDVKKRG